MASRWAIRSKRACFFACLKQLLQYDFPIVRLAHARWSSTPQLEHLAVGGSRGLPQVGQSGM